MSLRGYTEETVLQAKLLFSADRDSNEIAEAASSAKQDLSDDNRLEGNRRLEEETTRVQ